MAVGHVFWNHPVNGPGGLSRDSETLVRCGGGVISRDREE